MKVWAAARGGSRPPRDLERGRREVRRETNAPDFQQLEAYRAQLKAMLDTAREASAQQAALEATKQETTKRLRTLLAEGRKLATFLRVGVKQRYGNRAEKLVEFGLAPLRPRVRTPDAAKPPVTPTPNQPTT